MTTCQVVPGKMKLARFMPARARVAFALLLVGCASAADPQPVADCGGAPWSDVRRGVVACESGDRCAFSRETGALVPLESAEPHWVCSCGDPIHIYWCK